MALGVDEPTRWWVWGWTCLEYYAHSRGHAALQRAAEAFPADERLREEAAKHAAYADARGAEQREDAPGANEQQPALRVSSLSAETPDDGVVRSLAWFGGEPGLIVRTESRVISLEECAWVVAQAEAHAAAQGGWSTSRHVAYATTDIPLHTIDTLRAWFPRVLHERLFPLVASAPTRLVQVACSLHRWAPVAHSSMLLHEPEPAPLPLKPCWHPHVYVPAPVGVQRPPFCGSSQLFLAAVWIDGRMVTDVPADPSDETPHRHSKTSHFGTERWSN